MSNPLKAMPDGARWALYVLIFCAVVVAFWRPWENLKPRVSELQTPPLIGQIG